MLGKFVKVRVTSPMHSYNSRFGFKDKLNYGIMEGFKTRKNTVQFAYIMGINHPVRNFDGRVIAVVRRHGGKGIVWVVAPKSTRYIVNDIKEAINFAEGSIGYNIECLYESSCGAVIFRKENNCKKILLIRNSVMSTITGLNQTLRRIGKKLLNTAQPLLSIALTMTGEATKPDTYFFTLERPMTRPVIR